MWVIPTFGQCLKWGAIEVKGAVSPNNFIVIYFDYKWFSTHFLKKKSGTLCRIWECFSHLNLHSCWNCFWYFHTCRMRRDSHSSMPSVWRVHTFWTHTFSAVFNKLDFSSPQIFSFPPPIALLEVIAVMKASWYSFWYLPFRCGRDVSLEIAIVGVARRSPWQV